MISREKKFLCPIVGGASRSFSKRPTLSLGLIPNHQGRALAISDGDGQKKLADFFKSFMDEATIESRGIHPLLPALAIAESAWKDPTYALAELQRQFGLSFFFRIYSSPDKSNSSHSLAVLWQSGLGLPDRDYYFDADKKEKRDKYVEFIKSFFNLLGKYGVAPYGKYDSREIDEAANAVFQLEKELAASHLTRTLCRDAHLTYNKMTVSDLQKLVNPPISWATYLARGVEYGQRASLDLARYFDLVGKPVSELGDINVACVEAIKKASTVCFDSDSLPSILQHYLTFHIGLKNCKHLPKAFNELHFEFYEKFLQGTMEIKARFKRGVEIVEDALGFELGKHYVAKFFPEEYKNRALRIVELVRDALKSRLGEVAWMSEETKQNAMHKMRGFVVKIGYPEEWIDYTSLDVVPGKHMENVLAAQVFCF